MDSNSPELEQSKFGSKIKSIGEKARMVGKVAKRGAAVASVGTASYFAPISPIDHSGYSINNPVIPKTEITDGSRLVSQESITNTGAIETRLSDLTVSYDTRSGSLLVVNPQGLVFRSVESPDYIKDLQNRDYEVNVAWHTHGGKKPDIPLAYFIKTPDGKHTQGNLEFVHGVTVEKNTGLNSIEEANSQFDPHSLKAIYDQESGITFFVTDAGFVRRVLPPVKPIQDSLNRDYEVNVAWHTHGGKKPDIPQVYSIKSGENKESLMGKVEIIDGMKINY